LSAIRSPRDFWAGVFFTCLGLFAIVIGRDYRLGSAAAMGPAYFPTMLGGLLVLVGLIAVVRSFSRVGEPVGTLALRPLALVSLACISFAALLTPVGLIGALLALCLISAAASKKFGFEPIAVLGMVGLIAFCALVFVRTFHVPMPLLGTWFG
jgi:Tripartite tricarboxylate transporter TctB family